MSRVSHALARPARESEARFLAYAALFAGAYAFVVALVPFSPTTPRHLYAGAGAFGVLVGLVVWRSWRRLPVGVLHGVLVIAGVLAATIVHTSRTSAGVVVSGTAFIWIAVYSATFHERRVALGHLAGIGVLLAVALVASPVAVAPVQTWMALMATMTGVVVLLGHNVAELRAMSVQDPLTGVLTRRGFREAVLTALADARRTGNPTTLVVLDLDGFKAINDAHGHAAGDDVLVRTAHLLSAGRRPRDAVGRLGGDEFALVLPGTTHAEAEALMARLRARDDAPCAWTHGTAQWSGEDCEEWMRRADAAMYEQKRPR